jgi:hypothetical protein
MPCQHATSWRWSWSSCWRSSASASWRSGCRRPPRRIRAATTATTVRSTRPDDYEEREEHDDSYKQPEAGDDHERPDRDADDRGGDSRTRANVYVTGAGATVSVGGDSAVDVTVEAALVESRTALRGTCGCPAGTVEAGELPDREYEFANGAFEWNGSVPDREMWNESEFDGHGTPTYTGTPSKDG